MELQAIRYAAMVSTLTFDKLITIYEQYLRDNGMEMNAAESLLDFLEWSEPDEEQFGQEVKIVLASAEFSKELTTSVMWLNDFGLDIRCVRMHTRMSAADRSSSTYRPSSRFQKSPITKSASAKRNRRSGRPERTPET